MQMWQEGLLLLAGLWACQGVGTWTQMRHYRTVMSRITQRWPDGSVGASAARGTFGRGVVAIVVASPDQITRQVLLMEGRSVFAKFRECSELAGTSLATLTETPFAAAHRGRAKALVGAVAQIRKTQAGIPPGETTAALTRPGMTPLAA